MRRYLLDSNALNLFIFNPKGVRERALEVRRGGAMLGTAIPVLAELLGGTLYSESRDRNLKLVELKLKNLKIWPFDLTAVRR